MAAQVRSPEAWLSSGLANEQASDVHQVRCHCGLGQEGVVCLERLENGVVLGDRSLRHAGSAPAQGAASKRQGADAIEHREDQGRAGRKLDLAVEFDIEADELVRITLMLDHV